MTRKKLFFFILLAPLLLVSAACTKSRPRPTKAELIDATIQAILPVLQVSAEQAPEIAKIFYAQNSWQAPEGFIMEEITIHHLKMDFLRTKDEKHDKLIIQLHGGGYFLPSSDTYKDSAVRYAKFAPVDVLTPDYRIAPEHVFPAALDDAYITWNYALEMGYLPENIILTGESAGGNLALALTLKLKEEGKSLPRALILMSPWTDMSCSFDSHIRNLDKDLLFGTPSGHLSFQDPSSALFAYAADTPLDNPYLSPYFADLKKFPPMLIQVGTSEVLEDDSILLYEKAKKAGVEVKLTKYKNMFHCFQFTEDLPESKKAWKEIKDFIRKQYGIQNDSTWDISQHSILFHDKDYPFSIFRN